MILNIRFDYKYRPMSFSIYKIDTVRQHYQRLSGSIL